MTGWTSTAGSNQQTGTLTWNANGTLRQLGTNDTYNSNNNNNTCLYGYDDLVRLLSANCGSVWSQTFSYDVFGNITKSGSLSFMPTYGAGNHISSVPGQSISYDGMGNMTVDNLGNTYSYDAEGRPITAAGKGVTYDAFGRAVAINNGGAYTQIVYAPDGWKFAFMNGTAVQKYMVPLTAGMQAVYNTNGLQYYRHADWLGSSRFAATPTGSMYYDLAYAPFGESYAETGTVSRSFTGQTQDVIAGSNGIYDFLLRQQSAAQGRWLVPDPAGLAAVDPTNPQTWNRYAYVGNNPLSNVDPLGLDNDCGGPCTPFVLSSVGNCMTVVNYYKDTGEDGRTYDIPYTTFGCTGGGAGGARYYVTVREWDDIHGTGPCKGDPDCLGRRKPAAGTVANTLPSVSAVPARPPRPKTPDSTAGCVSARLIHNFLGNDSRAGVTVAINAALFAVVSKQVLPKLAASLLPGPGWLYAGAATLYDLGMGGEAYFYCRNAAPAGGGNPEAEDD
jgi:RHS repeat-associated protein